MYKIPVQQFRTGKPDLDRNMDSVVQAVRQLQQASTVPTSVTITSAYTVTRGIGTVTVSPESTSSITVSLPNSPGFQGSTRIVNNSAYPVRVRTQDSLTIFGDIVPGGNLTVTTDGRNWTA